MPLPLRKQEAEFTYADYLSWPDDERWELIEGIAYDMSPAPSRRHQGIQGEMFRQLADFLLDKPCRVYAAPFDVTLPEYDDAEDEEIITVVQPDIVVVCDEEKLNDRGCRGGPDIAIEIASPATGYKDRKVKRDLYERHGVKEYWIVDPEENTVMVFSLSKDGIYGKYELYGGDGQLKTPLLPGLEVDLSLVFRRS